MGGWRRYPADVTLAIVGTHARKSAGICPTVPLAWAHARGTWLVRCVRAAGTSRGDVLPQPLAGSRRHYRGPGRRRGCAVGLPPPGLPDRARRAASLDLPMVRRLAA